MNWINHLETLNAYIPVDILSIEGAAKSFLVLCLFIIGRYFLIVGSVFLYLYKTNHKKQKLHDLKISKEQYEHEIRWSLISTFIFAGSGVLMGILWQSDLTQIYLRFDQYPIWYLPISFILYSLTHEFYFYFTHIWMHQPRWYKAVHHVHHLSHKVSPWASFSFHPWECLVHAAFFPIMILFLPIHPVVIITYFSFMTLTAVSNHSGVEIFKSSTIKKYFISGEHHYLHHHLYQGNYGLFYTFIDKLFKTEISQNRRKAHSGEYV